MCLLHKPTYTPIPSSSSPLQASSPSAGTLLARARYNNLAETADELSFRQGDIVTVLEKDFNRQVDWWLCEMRGKVGMVPANYFEIFHDHESTYDIPRSTRTTPVSRHSHSVELDEATIYDFPPQEPERGNVDEGGNDYDFPPAETDAMPDYDRPPSRPGSGRSSLKSGGILLHRLSQTSASSGGTSTSQIYDVPPDFTDVYDKSSQPAKGFEEDEKGQVLMAVDIRQILDDEAEEMLASYCQLIALTYENLYQSVYGSDSYWGMDNKPRRNETLQKAMQATRQFDRALTALLEFGKGVANSLESSHDTNFKKRYASHYRGLLHKRHDILTKLDSLALENETITATVKSLLETARTIPSSVTEFTILVKANKGLLFRSSSKQAESLPVITKNEVKSRPLPELPAAPPLPASKVPVPKAVRESVSDYAFIPSEGQELPPRPPKPVNETPAPRATSPRNLSPSQEGGQISSKNASESPQDLSLFTSNSGFKKRNPQDELPPLPYATSPRIKKLSRESSLNCLGQGGSPVISRSDIHAQINGRQSPLSSSGGGEIIGHRVRSNCVSISRGSSPVPRPLHFRGQSYDSNLSEGSSSDLNECTLRRARSTDFLDGPYGRASTPSHPPNRSNSPQPLRRDERELLERFSKQMELITPSLRESVDVLLDCISINEPPKEFVTKSKLTVVAAYKLVYVADALCQKIIHTETKTTILASSNLLTESIKGLVSDTKAAALQYPSVLALERMGESLKRVFPSALDLVESVKSKSTAV